MKLKLVERKNKLNEQNLQNTEIFVETKPWNYLKLTCGVKAYSIIKKFVESGNFKNVLEKNTHAERKQMLDLQDEKITEATTIILGALNFIKPAIDSKTGFGQFEEQKAGISKLIIKTVGDISRVINHEGRTRTLTRWLMNPTANIKVQITQDDTGDVKTDWRQFPAKIIGQMDESIFVLSSEFKQIQNASSDANYIYIDLEQYSDGNVARISPKVFNKEYTRLFKFQYPKKVFFKLKNNMNPVVPINMEQLLNNFEPVLSPKQELNVDAASGDKVKELMSQFPTNFSK